MNYSQTPSAPSASSAKLFKQTLEEGLLGEGHIARWLNRRGWNVLPAYQVELDTGKGPRFYTADAGALVTPDILAIRGGQIWWVEAKTKSAFTLYRKDNTIQTGIDRRHWQEYLKVREVTPFPIWLLFLHKPGQSLAGDPLGRISPCGLFGEEIGVLCDCVDHESDKHGPTGMVYWRLESLQKLGEYADVTASPTLPFPVAP